jgi:hypothetical protein
MNKDSGVKIYLRNKITYYKTLIKEEDFIVKLKNEISKLEGLLQ